MEAFEYSTPNYKGILHLRFAFKDGVLEVQSQHPTSGEWRMGNIPAWDIAPGIRALMAALDEAHAENARLREALKERGHKLNCDMRKFYFSEERRAQQKCTCGLDAALAPKEPNDAP